MNEEKAQTALEMLLMLAAAIAIAVIIGTYILSVQNSLSNEGHERAQHIIHNI